MEETNLGELFQLIDRYQSGLVEIKYFAERFAFEIIGARKLPWKIVESGFYRSEPYLVDYGYSLMIIQHLLLGYEIDFDLCCLLLTKGGHYLHEDIAFHLASHPSPGMVDCLFNATQLQYDYLGYDESFQFARKCIKALSKIDNSQALEKLIDLSKIENSTIASYAKKELIRKGFP